MRFFFKLGSSLWKPHLAGATETPINLGAYTPRKSLKLGLLRTVSAAGLLSAVYTERIAGTADDLVSNPWKVANPTASDQNDRVFLEVVTFARNVHGDFFAVAQSNPSDFPKSRVRLLRGHRSDEQANALLLRALLKHRALCPFALNNSISTDQLVNRWHTSTFQGKSSISRIRRPILFVRSTKGARSTKGGSRTHTSFRTQDFESSASAIPPLWRRLGLIHLSK